MALSLPRLPGLLVDSAWAEGAGWIRDLLSDLPLLNTPGGEWLGLILLLALMVLSGLLIAWLVRKALSSLAGRTEVEWDERLVDESRWPVRVIIVLLVLLLAFYLLPLPDPVWAAVRLLLVLGFIFSFTWLAVRAVAVAMWALEQRFVAESDVGRSRAVRTQVMVLRKVATIALLVLGFALALLQFDLLRSIGTSVLASAGIVGVVVGVAAQKSISNLLAGIQLSITQPIRIDDTLIIEGEWGSVEDITLTYVVVRVWDLRRLVVPVSRFLEQPFQNWTKAGPELLGTVFIHADYKVPVEKMREEVSRLCAASDKWDGRAAGLIVTDATERGVQLRALVSAADSGKLWDLRCEVREGLVGYLQKLDGGIYLPRLRLEGLLEEGGLETGVASWPLEET